MDANTPNPELMQLYQNTFKSAALDAPPNGYPAAPGPPMAMQPLQQRPPHWQQQQQQQQPLPGYSTPDEFGSQLLGEYPTQQPAQSQQQQQQQQQQQWSYSGADLDFPGGAGGEYAAGAPQPGTAQGINSRLAGYDGMAAGHHPPQPHPAPGQQVYFGGQAGPQPGAAPPPQFAYDPVTGYSLPQQQPQQPQQQPQGLPQSANGVMMGTDGGQNGVWPPASFPPASVAAPPLTPKVKSETPPHAPPTPASLGAAPSHSSASASAGPGHLDDALFVLESHASGSTPTTLEARSPSPSQPLTPDSNSNSGGPAPPSGSGRGRGRGRGRGGAASAGPGSGPGPGRKVKKEDVLDPAEKARREKDRRFSNNTRERMRIRDINDALNELGQICRNLHPTKEKKEDESKPTTKLGVLNMAVEVITMLEKKVKERNMSPGQAIPAGGLPVSVSMSAPDGDGQSPQPHHPLPHHPHQQHPPQQAQQPAPSGTPNVMTASSPVGFR